MANYKDIKYQFPTSAVTSGTFADGRISESSVTQHASATDLQPLKADITALALREATNEASAAFNLPNQFIETFTDDTNLGTETDGDRFSGCWGTMYSVQTYNTQTWGSMRNEANMRERTGGWTGSWTNDTMSRASGSPSGAQNDCYINYY